MPLEGEYEPSPAEWVREQVRAYEATGGKERGDLQGVPVIILTTKGRRSGKLRKTPLMRVEHDGKYAVVASLGGAPKHPVWYFNVLEHPDVTLQDGPNVYDLHARQVEGDEKAEWWNYATAVWPAYNAYQEKTERVIPLVVLEPRG